MKNAVIYLLLALFAISGCKKYDEGPAISLRSKEVRLCQEWNEEQNLINGEDNTYYDDQYWNFNKDGTLVITTVYNNPVTELDWNYNWRWTDDKESIEISVIINKKAENTKLSLFTFSNNKDIEWQKLRIKKLKYEELVFEYEENGNLYRVELIKK